MRVHRRGAVAVSVAVTLGTAFSAGCGADRATAPDDANARAAEEFERAAAEIGFAVGPTAAITYQSAASALRGGARISQVEITVHGRTETWNAIGHEIRLWTSAGSPAYPFDAPPLRSFIAWQPMGSAMRVLHLLAASDGDQIRSLNPIGSIDDDGVLAPASYLMYAEGRNAIWEGVSGGQKSAVDATSTPCPQPARPAGAPAPPTCVEATFTFELTNVEARPYVPPPFVLTPIPFQNTASGTRTISMASQTIKGVQVTLTLSPVPFAPITGPPRP
jgi:hypothetical protein